MLKIIYKKNDDYNVNNYYISLYIIVRYLPCH